MEESIIMTIPDAKVQSDSLIFESAGSSNSKPELLNDYIYRLQLLRQTNVQPRYVKMKDQILKKHRLFVLKLMELALIQQEKRKRPTPDLYLMKLKSTIIGYLTLIDTIIESTSNKNCPTYAVEEQE